MDTNGFETTIPLEALDDGRFRTPLDRDPSVVLGGRELASAYRAAASTVPDHHALLSMGAWFIGRRDPDEPLTFAVRRLRDGRAFTTREVDATTPDGALWFRTVVTFHVAEAAIDDQQPAPRIAPLDTLTESPADTPAGADLPRNAVAFPWDKDFELRFDRTVPDIAYRFWARARRPTRNRPRLDDAAIIYATDLRGGAAGLLVSGWPTTPMQATTLDHTVWIHRPIHADDWFIIDSYAVSTHGARAHIRGSLFTPDGTHAATWAQTVLVRPT